MNFNRPQQGAAARSLERRTIRVELPSDDSGVIEALRRAFGNQAQCQLDREFESLLRQLH
jgi:hypothetical protein